MITGVLVVLLLLNAGLRYIFPEYELFNTIFAVASLILFLLVVQFFRNPNRKLNKASDMVLCPADGKIVTIEEIYEDEYFRDKRLLVSVFMSPVNVHVNRYAISGNVEYYKYHRGLYLVASHPKSSTQNERSTVVVGNGNYSVMLRQIAGYVARRIVTYCKAGDKAEQGEEFGFIKFGSRVDIIMPTNAEVQVKLGQVVKGGITHIAKIR